MSKSWVKTWHFLPSYKHEEKVYETKTNIWQTECLKNVGVDNSFQSKVQWKLDFGILLGQPQKYSKIEFTFFEVIEEFQIAKPAPIAR